MKNIKVMIINNNLLRQTIMESTEDTFFEGGNNFRWKTPWLKIIKHIQKDLPDRRPLAKRYEDFSEG